MKTFKQFVNEDWKKSIQDAGLKFADSTTMGGYKYARAGADYAVKNAMKLAGFGKGTDYETELNQEKEKLDKAEKESPRATAAGQLASYGVTTLAPYTSLKLANDALKAGEVGAKVASVARNLRTIIGR